MAKLQIEVFTAGCTVCEPAVKVVNELACPDCEVTVHDLRQTGGEQASRYGITRVPTVVVDGRIAGCCQGGGVDREQLRAAGVGQRRS